MQLSRILATVLVPCFLGFGAPASAQTDTYPSKPIKLIAGFAAGGPADGIARSIAQALAAELGQPVVVENRAGAAGTIGLDAVSASPADGYTIGLLANTTTNALHFMGKPLDVASRITPVGRFVSTRIVLVVNPNVVDVKTLPELVAYMRKNPGMTVTSAGHGGLGHLGLELFGIEQQVKLTHVSYRGSAPAMNDVIAGQVAAMVVDVSTALPHIQVGKLRPIVTVSTERIPSMPELPTALELGYKSLQIDSSMGIVMPPRTPQPIADRMRTALKNAVQGEFYIEAARRTSNARYFEDAPVFKDWLEKDFVRWGDVIRVANIKSP